MSTLSTKLTIQHLIFTSHPIPFCLQYLSNFHLTFHLKLVYTWSTSAPHTHLLLCILLFLHISPMHFHLAYTHNYNNWPCLVQVTILRTHLLCCCSNKQCHKCFPAEEPIFYLHLVHWSIPLPHKYPSTAHHHIIIFAVAFYRRTHSVE